MWPASTSTATPSGTAHPLTREVLSEPSGLMENSRPSPLASSTNSFPVVSVIVVVLSIKCRNGRHRQHAIHHAQHRCLLDAERRSGVRWSLLGANGDQFEQHLVALGGQLVDRLAVRLFEDAV